MSLSFREQVAAALLVEFVPMLGQMRDRAEQNPHDLAASAAQALAVACCEKWGHDDVETGSYAHDRSTRVAMHQCRRCGRKLP